MQDFVANSSRGRAVLMLLCSVLFVALGLWMVGTFGEVPVSGETPYAKTLLIGWSCILLFGAMGILWAKRLGEGGEELRIGASGIRWARWSDRTIPWSEISGVTTWSKYGQRSIVLHLYDPSAYPGRGLIGLMAMANRMFAEGDIHLSLTPTDRSFDEAMEAISRFRRMHHR